MSDIFELLRNFTILFCDFWSFVSKYCLGSSLFILTLPWSGNPYLIFEINRLSAVLLSLDLPIELLYLFVTNSLELSQGIIPPVLDTCVDHPRLSSKLIPSSFALVLRLISTSPILIVKNNVSNLNH